MSKLIVAKRFKWAYRGVDVVEYHPGDQIETDDGEMVAIAVEEGWAKEVDALLDAGAKPIGKAMAKAPENTAHANAPETK